MFAADTGSERATSVEDYQNTCTEFIIDISRDYMEWDDRYQLGDQETARRKSEISNIVKTTNDWMEKYVAPIKKVDIVMNDGVNKMAENTAGYPFKFEVYINSQKRYVKQSVGTLPMRVNAVPQEARRIRVGNYSKTELFLIASSSPISYTVSKESMNTVDILDDYITLDASKCERGDIISITIIVEEIKDDYVSESRGYSTVIRII